MSTPFHVLADQYDALTADLRALGDQFGVGNLTVPPTEDAPDEGGKPDKPDPKSAAKS